MSRLNYRCLNTNCTRPKGFRSIRGKLVFDEIRVIKEKLLSLPDAAYNDYLKEIKSYSDSTKTKLRAELARARTTKAGYQRRIAELSPSLSQLDNKGAQQAVSEQIAEAVQLV